MKPKLKSHLEFRKNRDGKVRAFVSGTRVRVQDIVRDYERHGFLADEIASEYPGITLAQVHTALAYYFENQAEIQSAMKTDDQLASSLVKNQKFLHNQDPEGDSVSS